MTDLAPVQINLKTYSELCKCMQSHIGQGTVKASRTINPRTQEERILPYLKKGRIEVLVCHCPSCGAATTKGITEVATGEQVKP